MYSDTTPVHINSNLTHREAIVMHPDVLGHPYVEKIVIELEDTQKELEGVEQLLAEANQQIEDLEYKNKELRERNEILDDRILELTSPGY